MREIKYEEIENLPPLVEFIYFMSVGGTPIGMSLYEEAIEKHPEYFPDEIEHTRKWDSIPQSERDEYIAKTTELQFTNAPKWKYAGIGGIIENSKHPDYWTSQQEHDIAYKAYQESIQPQLEALREQYLKPYGL